MAAIIVSRKTIPIALPVATAIVLAVIRQTFQTINTIKVSDVTISTDSTTRIRSNYQTLPCVESEKSQPSQ